MHVRTNRQLLKFMTKVVPHGVSLKRQHASTVPTQQESMNLSMGTHYSQPHSCPEAPYKPRLQAAAQPCGLCFKTDDYLRVIDAVRSERMVGLMPQRGTVLGGVVVGLWHVYHCLIVQGYCVSIEGPVSAVYLVCKAKIQCVCGEGSTWPAVWKQTCSNISN